MKKTQGGQAVINGSKFESFIEKCFEKRLGWTVFKDPVNSEHAHSSTGFSVYPQAKVPDEMNGHRYTDFVIRNENTGSVFYLEAKSQLCGGSIDEKLGNLLYNVVSKTYEDAVLVVLVLGNGVRRSTLEYFKNNCVRLGFVFVHIDNVEEIEYRVNEMCAKFIEADNGEPASVCTNYWCWGVAYVLFLICLTNSLAA